MLPLNHVDKLNVELVSWYITKRSFGVVYNIELGEGGGYNIELGGGGDTFCFANVQQLCNIGWNGLKGFVQDCLKYTEFNCA